MKDVKSGSIDTLCGSHGAASGRREDKGQQEAGGGGMGGGLCVWVRACESACVLDRTCVPA